MIEANRTQEILKYLCNELGGDWLLTGGALVRLKFDGNRATEDIDLMKISHPTLSDEVTRNELFRWLMKHGLGPEWVNAAVEPFVREAKGWENELVLLEEGSRGRVFRPSLTLFVYLKLRRGTAIDIADLKVAAASCAEKFDESKFSHWADKKTKDRFIKNRVVLGI